MHDHDKPDRRGGTLVTMDAKNLGCGGNFYNAAMATRA